MNETAEILMEIRELKAQMDFLSKAFLEGIPAWVTIQKASELKGINFNTLSNDKRLQPRFGVPDRREGARKYWSRETILEWLKVVGDYDRKEYAKKYPAEYALCA